MEYTAAQRKLRAQQAAYARWARTPDRVAATAPARRGWRLRWERQVDPAGTLAPAIRATLADAAMRSYMAGLRLKKSLADGRETASKAPKVKTVCSWCHPRVANKTHRFCERHAAQFTRECEAWCARHAVAAHAAHAA